MRIPLTVAFCLSLPTILLGAEPVTLTERTTEYPLGLALEILKDPTHSLTFENARNPQTKFEQSTSLIPNFGFAPETYWAKVRIQNASSPESQWLLEFSHPLTDNADFYFARDSGVDIIRSGDHRPFMERSIKHRNFLFDVNIPKGSGVEIFVRIRTDSSLQIPLTLWTKNAFNEKDHVEYLVLGLYYGLVGVMIIYNLVLYFSVRDFSYLLYVLYISAYAMCQFSLNGLSYEFLWPTLITWNDYAFVTFGGLSMLSLLQFSKNYLDLIATARWLANGADLLTILVVIDLAISPFIGYRSTTRVMNVLIYPVLVLMITAGIRASLRGHKPANYFLVAFGVLFGNMFLFAASRGGLIPSNIVTNYGIQIGSGLEVVLLSLGLANRISLIRKEKENAQREALERQTRMTKSFARFVPSEFLHFLGKTDITQVTLGEAVQKDMTVLFSDIRSFTTISEKMTPQENFDFLNAFFKRIGPLIRQHNGFIDKYIGDAIMALFPQSPDDAVQSAVEMCRLLNVFNVRRAAKGYDPVKIGIGIHTGLLMLGTIGEEERMESTVISDAVNLASRMEGLTKVYGSEILISEQSFLRLAEPGQYGFRMLDRVRVKGKSDSVSVFEILDEEVSADTRLKLATRALFERGVISYVGQNFAAAKESFQHVASENPNDAAATLYLARIEEHMKYGLPADWEPISAMDSK